MCLKLFNALDLFYFELKQKKALFCWYENSDFSLSGNFGQSILSMEPSRNCPKNKCNFYTACMAINVLKDISRKWRQ